MIIEFRSSAVRQFGSLAAALLIASIAVGCTMWKVRTNPAWSSATSPDQYERLMWESAKNGDVNEVIKHLSSNFVRIGPAGRQDRDATIEDLRKMKLTAYEISDLTSTPAGDDMVITYTLLTHGSVEGRQFPEQPWHVMTVWRVAKHGWLAIAQSFTPASQPATSKP